MASSASQGPATKSSNGTEPDWLTERRREGERLAGELELPGPKAKGWEFTDLSELDLDSYPSADGGDPGALERASLRLPAVESAVRIDQVDHLALSAGDDVLDTPDKPLVLPLAAAAERFPDLVKVHLGSVVSAEDPFAARNEVGWRGGAFVYVPRGARLEAPVQITAVQDAANATVDWRTLIVLEAGAEAEVWERWISTGDELEGVFNTVVELSVAEGANLRYVCGQELSERSWVFGTQRAEVGRDASLDWVSLGFGSGRGKVRMETKLAGRGSSAKVTGAYAGNGHQHLDFDTKQEHAAESTTSDLAFRGVLEDSATAVWRGMISVDPGAQQTDAFQESRNLLLSKNAHADAIPGLEIEANDVRCTHAAAVAQVDKEQLFYLTARGLRRDVATRLVIDGFMQALVERLAEGPVREAVSEALEKRLEEILA